MTITSAPISDLNKRTRKATCFCLPLNHPRPSATLPPVVCEAKKIELLPPGWFWRSLFTLRRLTEFDQPGFLRMNGEAVLPESFRQYLHHSLGVLLLREHKHCIICKPDHERFPS